MAEKPLANNLPADLPENWQIDDVVAPAGEDAGLTQQHGYNYQSKQINEAQKAINILNNSFETVMSKDESLTAEEMAERFTGKTEKIYFKKNADNWTDIRIYFFNKDSTNSLWQAWDWSNSPYMTDEGGGLYSYPMLPGYSNVIFYCDIYEQGVFHQTTDLLIPPASLYGNLLYIQSDIGYNGIWADYNGKSFNLYVKADPSVTPTVAELEAKYTTADDSDSEKTKQFQYMGYIDGSLYYFCGLPINTVNLNVRLTVNKTTYTNYDDSDDRRNTIFGYCYNVPCVIIKYDSGTYTVNDREDVLSNAVYQYFVDSRELNWKANKKDVYSKSEANTAIANAGQKMYFKKNCSDWRGTPRAYFYDIFLSHSPEHAWRWEDSPAMTREADNLYSITIPNGYRYVIFFSDDKTEDGVNYKTSDLLIPPTTLYETPIYTQSSIGFDGFWGDYYSKTFRMFMDNNLDASNPLTKLEIKYTTPGNSHKRKKTMTHIGWLDSRIYYMCELPIDIDYIEFIATVKGEEYSSYSESNPQYNTMDTYCYNIPTPYVTDNLTGFPRFMSGGDGFASKAFYRYFTDCRELKNKVDRADVYTKDSVNTIITNVNKRFDNSGRKIYFKKNCEEWSTPQAYFFDNCIYWEKAWEQSDGPPMKNEGNGLYSITIPNGYRYVQFFCDKANNDGTTYRTYDLLIPPTTLYENPIYVQSKIGYQGFWGDYYSQTFRMFYLSLLSSSYPITKIEINYTSQTSVGTQQKTLTYGGYLADAIYYFVDLPLDIDKIEFVTTIYGRQYSSLETGADADILNSITGYCYNVPYIYITNDLMVSHKYGGRVNGFTNKKFYRYFTDCRELKNKVDRDDVYNKDASDKRYPIKKTGTVELTSTSGEKTATCNYSLIGNVLTVYIYGVFGGATSVAYTGLPYNTYPYTTIFGSDATTGNIVKGFISNDTITFWGNQSIVGYIQASGSYLIREENT